MQTTNFLNIPNIIFGTWKLGLGNETIESVKKAISVGFRGIDSAYSYSNDFFTGKAIKGCDVPRENLFITNKVWKTFQGKDAVIEACKKSLKLMKLDYFDLYLVHWPVSINSPNWERINHETWLGMEYLYKNGLVKAIGVSNFLPHHIQSLIDRGITILPMVNQIEYHIGYTQSESVDYCKEKGILLEAWSPLGSGTLLNNKLIKTIAEKKQVTPALICLRYVIEKGIIPVVRSSNEQRMLQNLQVFNFSLTKDELLQLDNINGEGFSGFHPDFNQPKE